MTTKQSVLALITANPGIEKDDIVSSIQFGTTTTREYILQCLRELTNAGSITKDGNSYLLGVEVTGSGPSIAPAPVETRKILVIRTVNRDESQVIEEVTRALNPFDRHRKRVSVGNNITISILNTSNSVSEVSAAMQNAGSNAIVTDVLPENIKELILAPFI